ncbi:MAG: glycosyltransferase [Actinomycetota bacterium]
MATRTEPERARAAVGGIHSGLPTVLAIVVTHDGRTWLRDCLVGLNMQTYLLLDVLVVDDASRDSRVQPTLKRIAKRHLRRRRWGYLRTPRPLGFGGAINWAMSRVRTDADFLLFIHDDAALERTSVELMVARMLAHDDTAIVGPKIVDWEDPSRLEEIGMAIDRYGYPYKGLEEHEIDLGQHDKSVEVFYVTSTCMLIRHEVFRDLRGWDAKMRAFSEDLDLCWRARLAGHAVRVEPHAKARHAIALATGKRRSQFVPPRYFIRRNRFRTIAKNVSRARLLSLLPAFVLLAIAEMIVFITLRQPREILNLARALGWNVLSVPQTLTARARAQRLRQVPDRNLRRLMVGQGRRVRFYATHQAGRLEEAWGRRAELLARRGRAARSFGLELQGFPGVMVMFAVIVLVVGFRHIIWGPSVVAGEILPYPERATALLRAFVSPWHGSGLGQGGAAPPAFALLGTVPLITLGATGVAQKVLILGMGLAGFLGAYRLLGGLVDRPSRLVGGLIYVLGAVGFAGVRNGALGALVLGAAAPFVLTSLLRLIGWVRPPRFNRSRAVAGMALGTAISAAFVPGSVVLYLVATVLLTAVRAFLDRGDKALRGLMSSIIGIATGWALLLPWSWHWLDDGGPLDRLRDGDSWSTFAAPFADHGMASVLLGQTPSAPTLFGLALPLLGLVAVLVSSGQRRRVALSLWSLILATGWLITAISAGALRPIVASPTEAGVLASLAFSALAGLAVGAFRLDLPRRGLGFVHALTFGCLALAGFLVVVGLGPAVLRGGWDPGRGGVRVDAEAVEQIRDLLATEGTQGDQFRALWVGEAWTSPVPSSMRPLEPHMVTGPRGQVLSDLFENSAGDAEQQLRRVIASVEEGATDRGGSLLGAFNVRFVVLQRSAGATRWLSQRDLALIRSEPEYMLLENGERLDRAAVYEEVPGLLEAIERGDPVLARGGFQAERSEAVQESASEYVAEDVGGPGFAVLAERQEPGWEATVDGGELESVDGGWANVFEIPSGESGRLTIAHPRTVSDIAWLVAIALAWGVVVSAAFARAQSPARRILG